MSRWIRVSVTLCAAAWGCSAEVSDGGSTGSELVAPSDVPITATPQGAAGSGALPMQPLAQPQPQPTPTVPAPGDATIGMPVMETPMVPVPTEPTAPAEEPPPMEEPPPTGGVGVPATAYCMSVADWDPMWAQFEEEVLLLVNENRAAGANCGGEVFPAAPPLTMQENLRCSARLHSADMGLNDYFSHTSEDGRTVQDRIQAAGYGGSWYGENIAWGQQSPAEVMAGWMDSPGHCSNIMNDNFTEIGIGYYRAAADPSLPAWEQAAPIWTQNFGRPGGW